MKATKPLARILGYAAATAGLFGAITGCDDIGSLKTRSGGEPYEVVLIADNDTARHTMAEALQTDIAGLPQRENAFDVTPVKASSPNQATRYARCIVIAETGSAESRSTAIRYEKDAYASPQLIIYVSSPTAAVLQRDVMRIKAPLARLINRFEANDAIAELHRHNNPDGAKAVADVTGCSILIPDYMQATRRGKDFIWLSDNSKTVMRNICVYTYPGTDNSAGTLVAKRDSVMKANITGMTPGSYMRTSTQTPVYHTTAGKAGRQYCEVHGLWETEGDIMGGPFVSRAIKDPARNRTVVAEAFVYAPDKPKRNILKQLEAALATLRPAQ